MQYSIAEIVTENKRRNNLLDADYDPFIGTGGPIKRVNIVVKDMGWSIFIPCTQLEEPTTSALIKHQNFNDAANELNISRAKAFENFIRERYKHDFEFWAASTITIVNKDTFKKVPFILRGAQRKLLAELEEQRVAGVPIRIVLLKARQWGGSTLVQIYMMWIQQLHRENWNLAVCAQVDDAAKNISGMYDTAAKFYPKTIGEITLKSFKGSTKNRIVVERDALLNVGSYLNPDQFRSYNFAMVHLSEVGLWKDTEKIKAMDLITSLKETVPDQPYTLIVEESTAKGLNYFYESWKKAVAGKSRYKAVFIPWFEIDRCRENITISPDEFIKSWEDYHWFLWSIGATLEGINWYIKHKEDKGYQDWEMMSENPSTPEEAFQSTGQKVYPPNYILALRRHNLPPVLIGDVYADARMGDTALDNVNFQPVHHGNLRLWQLPDKVKEDAIKYRFCGFADIGGISKGADYSCFKLIDREPMLYGCDPVVAAVWHGHLDQDLFAWKCAQICKAFSYPEIGEYPLLAFEVQSLHDKGTEGNHSLTILDQLKNYYPNLYTRNDHEKVGDEWVPKYGFHTNTKTKGLIIDTHRAAMREVFMAEKGEQNGWGYIERDSRACDEFSWFETKENGKMGNIDGKHDDHVIISAGAVWLAVSRMDMPVRVNTAPKVKRNKKRRTYASY